MRRLTAILLLLLLPLQFSWALAAAYCQHEAAPDAQHFGHHEHRHDAHLAAAKSAKSDASPATKLPGGVDGDCSVCHAGCAAAVTDIALLSVVPATAVAADLLPAPPPAAPASRPERPDWHRLA